MIYGDKSEKESADKFHEKHPVNLDKITLSQVHDKPTYTAANIRVLTEEEIEEFAFAIAPRLASHYQRPLSWVKRVVTSAQLAGIDIDYIEEKYFQKRKVGTHKNMVEFMEIYKEMVQEETRC